MTFGVVIPYGAGRHENLTRVMDCIARQTVKPVRIVIVCDGEDAWIGDTWHNLPVSIIHAPKHHPGMEQPRNLGARYLAEENPEVTHVAFLDTDIVFKADWLEQYKLEIERGGEDGLYYGPYEFLPQGFPPFDEDFRADVRWPMFRDHEPGARYTEDLSKGLGAFSGNLVWNLDDFGRIGGFWEDIHHGRCEDGEHGARAVAMGIRIGQVPAARGWHLWHPVNMDWARAANTRDVPMLNERHPWLEGRCVCGKHQDEHPREGCEGFRKAIFVVEEDGRRFNARCRCGWEGNTALIWQHRSECDGRVAA